MRNSGLVGRASLRGEYGLDSVAAVNVVFALESKLDREIDIEQFAGVNSIDDIAQLLRQLLPREDVD